jgi:hypothetical protein
MKIFCHIPRENWFCDRYGREFKDNSKHKVSHSEIYEDTNVIWLLAGWCWDQINPEILKSKKVVCTIHHEVPWKFNENRQNIFIARDRLIDYYHVPCEKTKEFISTYTKKPITVIPYWCNNNLFKKYNKEEMKSHFNLPSDKMIVSSFQRDTEGFDLKTPKLEKGPDIFVDYVIKLSKQHNIHVLLNGWRRQYVMQELEKNKIEYSYFELPKMEEVVKMYSATDLYVVGSRVEGGPQSILECAITETPIVSTDVGIARKFLSEYSIFNPFEGKYSTYLPEKSDIAHNLQKVQEVILAKQIPVYDTFFESLQ